MHDVVVGPDAALVRAAVPHLGSATPRSPRRRPRRVAAGREESDQSAHIGQYSRLRSVPTADAYSWACRPSAVVRPTNSWLAHPAPGRDVGAGGRVVGLDRDRRADATSPISPGQVDDRQRAASAAAVDDHERSPWLTARSRPARPGRRQRPRAATARNSIDLGLGRRVVQRHPHVARRQRAHRDQHVRRLERRGGARRAGGHGEPAPVQRGQQRLAVDVQAART